MDRTIRAYRQQAAEARRLAAAAASANEREIMLQVAETWDNLAEAAIGAKAFLTSTSSPRRSH